MPPKKEGVPIKKARQSPSNATFTPETDFLSSSLPGNWRYDDPDFIEEALRGRHSQIQGWTASSDEPRQRVEQPQPTVAVTVVTTDRTGPRQQVVGFSPVPSPEARNKSPASGTVKPVKTVDVDFSAAAPSPHLPESSPLSVISVVEPSPATTPASVTSKRSAAPAAHHSTGSTGSPAQAAAAPPAGATAAAPAAGGAGDVMPEGLTKEQRRAWHQERLRSKESAAASAASAPSAPSVPSLRPGDVAAAAAAAAAAASVSATASTGAPGDGPLSPQSGGGLSVPSTDRSKRARRNSNTSGPERPNPPRSGILAYDDPQKMKKHQKAQVLQRTTFSHKIEMFAHLPQYESDRDLSLQLGVHQAVPHPAIVRLGLRFADGTIRGATARCHSTLVAFKQFIEDYQLPPDRILSRDLLTQLGHQLRFLIDCRPQGLSMGNVVRLLKRFVQTVPVAASPEEGKAKILADISSALTQMEGTFDVIAIQAADKIRDGDVVMTFATSHLVEKALQMAHSQGRKFRVVVADSRPLREGMALLRRLVGTGIPCSYVTVNAVSSALPEVTMVMVGAQAMLSNGSLVARVGTGMVALMARTFQVPVLVLCETFKFHERVSLESISYNELGDPDELVNVGRDNTRHGTVLRDWRDQNTLKLLNLVYDLTPVQYVDMVVTELGCIPATSVPVVIREYQDKDK